MLAFSEFLYCFCSRVVRNPEQCPRLRSSFPCYFCLLLSCSDMPNLGMMYSATFPTKPGNSRLRESGQIGQKLNVPKNMSGHYCNKKTRAKCKKETNYTIYGTDGYSMIHNDWEDPNNCVGWKNVKINHLVGIKKFLLIVLVGQTSWKLSS